MLWTLFILKYIFYYLFLHFCLNFVQINNRGINTVLWFSGLIVVDK